MVTRFPNHIGPSTVHQLIADCWLGGMSEAETIGRLRLIDARKRDAVLVIYRALEYQLEQQEMML